MFCNKCGREIADDSKVCGYCGTPAGSRQETNNHQTQKIYGEPEANYSGQTGTASNSNDQNRGFQNTQGSVYQSGGFQNTQGSAYQNGGFQNTQGTSYQNGGFQNSQGTMYQNGYSQNTGYGTPQNMDGGATGMGIASMILGIIALLFSCCVNKWWLTIIVAASSIVLGILSIQKNTGGKGMAIAGIICSCVATLVGVIVVILGAALLTSIFALL